MDDAERDRLNRLILDNVKAFDALMDPKFIEIYRTGWVNKHAEIEEGTAAGVGGARSLAGILALTRDPDFLLAMAEKLVRLGFLRINGFSPEQDISDWREKHMDQFTKRYDADIE